MMQLDQCGFAKGAAGVSASSAFVVWSVRDSITQGTTLLVEKMRRRLLASPFDSPPDLLVRPSPLATPFQKISYNEFRPPIERSLFEVREANTARACDGNWWGECREKFLQVADSLRTDGFAIFGRCAVRSEEFEPSSGADGVRIDSGGPLDPTAHQHDPQSASDIDSYPGDPSNRDVYWNHQVAIRPGATGCRYIVA